MAGSAPLSRCDSSSSAKPSISSPCVLSCVVSDRSCPRSAVRNLPHVSAQNLKTAADLRAKTVGGVLHLSPQQKILRISRLRYSVWSWQLLRPISSDWHQIDHIMLPKGLSGDPHRRRALSCAHLSSGATLPTSTACAVMRRSRLAFQKKRATPQIYTSAYLHRRRRSSTRRLLSYVRASALSHQKIGDT